MRVRRDRWFLGVSRGIVIVAVWWAGAVGWAAPLGRAPDEGELQRVEELTTRYERLLEEGNYSEGTTLANQACLILEKELGVRSERSLACLGDLALLYQKQGRYVDAQPLLSQILVLKEKVLGSNHADVAGALNDLALLYCDQGAYSKAEPLLKRALSTFEKTLGKGHADSAGVLNNLAELYSKQGLYGKAKPLYKRSLFVLEKSLGPDHLDVAVSVNNFAMLCKAQGEYEEAEPLFKRAISTFEKKLGSNHPLVAVGLNNLALLYQEQGAYEKAEPIYERALSINERALGPGHPDVATSLSNLAALYDDQGFYGKAKLLYERALSIYERSLGFDHPLVGNALNNLGLLNGFKGAYDKAEPLLVRAIHIAEKTLGPDHPSIATMLNNLAGLYWMQGSYGKAEPLLERALDIDEAALGPFHTNVARDLNDLAMLCQDQNAHAKAEALLRRALSISEKSLGPMHPEVAIYLNNLSSLYHDQGAYQKAEPLLEQALIIFESTLGRDHAQVAVILHNLAVLFRDQGSYEKAEPLFMRSIAIDEKIFGPYHPVLSLRLNNLAILYHERGEQDLAFEMRRQALRIEEKNLARGLVIAEESRRLAYAASLSGSLRGLLSHHLRGAFDRHRIAGLALTTLLRRKNRVQDLIGQSNAALRRSLPEAHQHLLDNLSLSYSRYAALAGRGSGTFVVENLPRQLDELQAAQDEIWGDLAKHNTLVRDLDRPVTLSDLQNVLSSDAVLGEFVGYVPLHDDAGIRVRKHEPQPPSRYAVYLLYHDHFDWLDLGPAEPIEQHITAFRRALQLQLPIPADLHDSVMQPILDRLPANTTHLIIAPDGALNLIPFGALYDGERYLIEKYTLRHITTGRDLLPRPSDPVTTTAVTVVANPLGTDRGGTELEAAFLTSLFSDARVFQHTEATETNVRTIERPLVLHMATHGFFGEARHERDNPMLRSGILLADVEQIDDPTIDRELDDGQLTAYEVSGWDLRGTQLVVLSACETALGALHMGEGVLGLRRAFAMAGAQTQVMSLWQVGDVTSQKLMEAYYLELAKGRGRGEAMQDVQLEMLRTEDRSHPHHWAAFVVTGDDSPMSFPEGQEPQIVSPPGPGQGPPPHGRRPTGCSVAPTSDRDLPVGMFLFGLLGLSTLRRRQ